MAIIGTNYAGTESKWGMAEEATFGTAIADNQAFVMLEGPIPSVDYGVTRINQARNDGGRVKKDTGVYYTQTGGIRQINFSDLVVRRKDLASLLFAVCQNVDEGETPLFTKVFTIDETTTQLNFAANSGYFATIGIYDTIAAYHRKFTSCMLSNLTLTADLTGDGLLKASGTWLSGFAANTTATFSGAWAYNTQNYWDYHAPAVKQIADADIVMYGWSLTINNNAVRVGGNTSGNAETYSLPEYDVSGSITVKYDTSVQGIIADSLAGTARKIDLDIGSVAADGHFGMVLHDCFFGDIAKDYGDPRGQALTIPFQVTFNTGGDLAVFTVVDSTDMSWPT